MKDFFFILSYILLWSSCSDKTLNSDVSNLMDLPPGFSQMEIPDDNQYTPERWTLGKMLFYDPILSVDNTISCASCHKQELAFSDGLVKSEGVESRGGQRNTPSLANIGYHPYFTREGGVPTLEMQVLVPIQEHAEMDFNIVLAAERLAVDDEYVKMSQEAYGEIPSPYVITRALANFERSLISGQSKYDHVISGLTTFSPSEALGYQLFHSEALKCASCHSGINFTNYSFENNGLYDEYVDMGRFRLTGMEKDRALFKTPSLRNVSITSPYMHDGSLADLDQVLEHYQSGGRDHPHKNEHIQGFKITKAEKEALISFLVTLSDYEFINNEKFRNE